MDDIGGTRTPVSNEPATRRESANAPVMPRRRSGMRTVLGSLIVLLLVGAAVYYFAGRNTGTDATHPPEPRQAERATETPASPPPSQSAARQTESPAVPAPPEAPSSASQPQQSASPAPPSVPAPSAGQAEAVPSSAPATAGQQSEPMSNRASALPASDELMVVQAARANIRSEPGRNGRVIGTAVKGSQVKVIGRSKNWVEVESDAGKGWISGSLLRAQTSGAR